MCKQVACCMRSFLSNYLPTSLLANMLQSGAKRLEAEVISTFLEGPCLIQALPPPQKTQTLLDDTPSLLQHPHLVSTYCLSSPVLPTEAVLDPCKAVAMCPGPCRRPRFPSSYFLSQTSVIHNTHETEHFASLLVVLHGSFSMKYKYSTTCVCHQNDMSLSLPFLALIYRSPIYIHSGELPHS